jgi:hypothetical protein
MPVVALGQLIGKYQKGPFETIIIKEIKNALEG